MYGLILDRCICYKAQYPADFISEAIDQTRGWFYTLHAVGVLMGRGKAYKNVICLGHILDSEGKKMSKSIGNIVDPWQEINRLVSTRFVCGCIPSTSQGIQKIMTKKTVIELERQVFDCSTIFCHSMNCIEILL